MSDSTLSGGPATGAAGGRLAITLQPFASWRQAALAPDPALGIVRATLIQVSLRWHNALNESAIRRADDLFACAALDGSFYDPVPHGAEIIEVILEFQFADCPEPHLVHLKPPATILLQYSTDAPRVRAFLVGRGFLVNHS